MSWQESRLGDICELIYGKGLKGYSENSPTTHPVQVFGTNGPIGWTNKSLNDEPAIIIGRKGAYRGVHIAKNRSWTIDTAYFMRILNDDIDLNWLYYRLRLLDINSMNSGAAIPSTKREDFYAAKIKIPDYNSQITIAGTLQTYDDLIENNRRRIALLEEAARLLYREWFVHFRFPGHEHAKIIDGVPEGWVEGRVSDLGLAITGKTPSKKVEANFGDEVPFIKTPDMHGNVFVISTEESLSEQGAKTQSKKTVPVGSIMVSCIGTVGAVAMNARPSQTNQQINTIIPKYPQWQFFSFFALKAIKPRLEAMGGGATMANVNKTKFESVPILLPSNELILSFHEIVKPLFELIEKLARQNIELSKARDLLLPRLMDGRIEV